MQPANSFYFFSFILLISGATLATPQQAETRSDPVRTASISALLDLQRAGTFASTHPQTLPGAAQTKAWQRYLDSFAHPIPARYIDDSFKPK